MATRDIRTPKGKRMTPRQYLALKAAQDGRETWIDYPCAEGHFGCAAWEHGPCSAELEIELGIYEED